MDSITVSATIERTVAVGDKVRIVGQRFAFDTFFKAGEVKAVGHGDKGAFVKIEFLGGVVILHGEANIAKSIAPAVAASADPMQVPPPVQDVPTAIPGGFSMMSIGQEKEPDGGGVPPGLTKAQMLKSRSAGASIHPDADKLFLGEPVGILKNRSAGAGAPENDVGKIVFIDEQKVVTSEESEDNKPRLSQEAPDIEPL